MPVSAFFDEFYDAIYDAFLVSQKRTYVHFTDPLFSWILDNDF